MLKTQHSSQQKVKKKLFHCHGFLLNSLSTPISRWQDVDTLSSKQKQYETDLASRDLKIKRLMEQLEKAKLNSRSTDSDIKDKQRQTQGELEQSRLQLLQKKNKNEELMKVVAKQQELIHVLKRQQQLLVGSAMVDISLNDLNKVYNSV